MRKFLFIFSLLLLAGSCFSQNLVTNPGLETGTLTPWGAWNPSGTASVVNTSPHSGTWAVKLNGGECSIEQLVSGLKANTQYQLSCWGKLGATTNSVAIGAKNYGGAQIFVNFSSTDYEQKSLTFTTGASNTSVKIFMYKAPGGTGADYGDDFQLIEIGTPVANFTASTRTIQTGASVTFSDMSSATPTSWQWSFPGGTPSTSTDKNPTVTYNAAGTYDVTLTSVNASGTSAPVTKSACIKVVDLTKSSTYYVSNSTGNDANDGKTPATAWKTLSKVNSVSFNPGDSILFKCADVWNGNLKPQGSGMANYPIVIDMYGTYTDKASKPHIQTQGKAMKAVHLNNVEYWEVNNLQISNYNASGNVTGLAGFCFESDNYGVARHLHAKKLYIHDVNGNNSKNAGPNNEGYGVLWYNHGTSVVSTFDDMLIEDCYLEKTDRNGIMGWGYTDRRDWHPSTNIVIRRNSLNDIGGDGIVILGTHKALVEYNLVNKFRMRAPNDNDPSAGIWPVHADSTLIQYNEACYGKGARDGQGFDADCNCRGSIFQYNYSHNNDGGFMLIINYESAAETKMTGTIIRYNVSVNDGAFAKRLFHMTGKYDDCQIYNNTFYMGEGTDIRVFLSETWPDGYPLKTVFTNNIFYTSNVASATYSTTGMSNFIFNNNVFNGTHKYLTSLITSPNTASPMFVAPGSSAMGMNTLDGYKLQSASTLIGAGKLIDNNGGKDYFGNPVSKTNPTIGAAENTTQTVLSSINADNDLIEVYPMPAKNNISVKSKLHSASAYSIIDNSGKTLVCGKLNIGENKIDSSGLKNGVYFLHVAHPNKSITKPIMVGR